MLAAAMKSERVDFETVRCKKDGSARLLPSALHVAGGECIILSTQKDVTYLKAPRDAKLVEANYPAPASHLQANSAKAVLSHCHYREK